MKQLWMTGILAVLLFACNSENKTNSNGKGSLDSGKLSISGKINGMDTGTLELFSSIDDGKKPDTLTLTDGTFSHEMEIPEPVQLVLRKPGTQGEELVFFADPGKVTIEASTDSIWAAKVDAGPSQKIYKEAEDTLKNLMFQGQMLYAQYMEAQQKQDGAQMQAIEQKFMETQLQQERFATRFGREHNNSVIAAYIGLVCLGEEGKQDQMKNLYDTLTMAVQASYFGKKMGNLVQAAQGTSVGAQATDFTLPDVNGKPVSLSSFKGKYVLIDFWASWCGPCREENPNVVSAYNKFKSKDFTVLGVSLDRTKDAWTKAIQDDQLSWTHVSDLKYWDSEAAKLYNIQAIPANFLLDKDGKIIGKNLRGEELVAKLNEVLN